MGGEHIGAHELMQIAGLTFHWDTLKMTWLTMVLVLVFAVVATRGLSLIPSRWQSALELVVEALGSQIDDTLGARGQKLKALLISLFLFIFFSNQLGLIPGMKSPTSDLNTTLGLALMIICMVHVLSIANKGIVAYIKHYFQPFFFFFIINLIEELAKPVTLSVRLFGNIMAGEILLLILTLLIPLFVPTIWLAFSLFIGTVQAFIFTMLSMSYLASALESESH